MKLDVLRLAFVVEDQPVPSAMESFARAAGLECEWLGPTSVSLRPVQRVTFGFKDADVRRILEVIMTVSGASFIVSPDVRGTVTMSVDNAPWMDVLTALARTAGLVIVREDSGILRILKE